MTVPEGLIRLYSGSAVETSITADIIETSTSIPLQNTSGYPSPAANQYVAVRLGEGGADEEIIYYGNKNGNTLQNCLRGQDGTVARTHKTGEKATHTSTALDFREANVHANTIDPAFVPHAHQLVHQSVAQTVSAAHAFTGNSTHTGTETFTDVDITSADITTLRPATIAGPVNVTGVVTYATPAAVPNKITGTTALAGSSSTPMRSDATLAVDAKSMIRIAHPAGETMEWALPNLPDEPGHENEWAWADGSEITIASAPIYAAKAGTIHGTASAGKVRLPDKRGRHGVGVDTNHALGGKGGNYTHQNTIGEMVSHNHGGNVQDPGHDHAMNGDYGQRFIVTAGGTDLHIGNSSIGQTLSDQGNIDPSQTGIQVNFQGGSQAYNIETPWIGMRYIVKIH